MSDRLQLLLEEVGQFGPFQWRLSAVSIVIIILSTWRSFEYMFTTARISTRCLIKECEDPDDTQFTPAWLGHAMPIIDGHFDNCRRFARAANTSASTDASCPAELFDTSTTVACESFVYENKNTVAYDFGLACDEWHRSLIGSFHMAAWATGMPIMGFVSDRWGRRLTLIVNEFLVACLGVLRYWITSYEGYVAIVFIESAIGCSQYACVYVLVMETVGSKYRVIASSMNRALFSVGLILLTLLAWAVPYWRTFILVLYMPQLLICCYFWIIPESIRWNLSRGNYDAAEAGLIKMAHLNGKKISEESLQELRQAAEEQRQQEVDKNKDNEPWLVIQVFRNKQILLRSVVTPVFWITMMMVYYGLAINTTNLFGNKYLNFALVFGAEIPGAFLAMLLLHRAGRRLVLAVAYFACAACQIVYIFMPRGMVVASLVVYLVGKLCISVVLVTLYVYTTELYPTRYRQNFLNYCTTVGKIGSVVAPLTPVLTAVWVPMPFVLFASMALLSGLLVLVLPETRGTVLPDTMQQAAQLLPARALHQRAYEDLGLLADRNRLR